MTIPRRVLRNTASNYVGLFIERGLWFLLTPFILHQLGTGDYGLWILVGSVVAYGSLLDLAIPGAIVKYVAEYHAKGEPEQARNLIATTLSLYSILGFIVFVFSAAVAAIFPSIFNISPERQAVAANLVMFMGLGVGIGIPCGTAGAVLQGLQRYDLVNLIRILGSLIVAIATVIVLLFGGGVLGIVAVSIITMLLMQVPSVWAIHRIAPALRFGSYSTKWSLIQPIISFSSPLFVMKVSGRVQTKSDEIVIGMFLPINAVTPYAIARALSEVVLLLTDQYMRVLLPLAAQLNAENATKQLRIVYVTGTRLALAISLLIACPLMFLSEPILILWVGESYAEYSHVVLILALACLIDTSQWPAGSVLQSMSRHKPLAKMSVCAASINLVLSIALIQGLGLTGVALGTLIPTAIVCLGFVLPYAMRVIGISAAEIFQEVFWPTFLPAIPLVITLSVLQQIFEPISWLAVISMMGTGMLLYLVGYLGMGASNAERQTFRALLLSMIRPAAAHH